MSNNNNSNHPKGDLEQSIIYLENLAKNIEQEEKLDLLLSCVKEFSEKFSLIHKEISHKNVCFSIIKKDTSGKEILDHGQPILEKFITEKYQ